jgi:hypothetical protein
MVSPSAPRIWASLRRRFKINEAGRTFSIEAFATDDAGNEQGFDPVGAVAVRRR